MPRRKACIMVANYVNLLDSPLLGVSLGRKVYFMAKEELFHSRFIDYKGKPIPTPPLIFE